MLGARRDGLWVQGVRLCIERRQRDIRGDSWQYILASAYRCRPVPRLVVHAIAMPVLGVDVSQSEVSPCLLRALRAPVKDIEAAGGSPSAILSSSEHSRAFALPCPPVDGHCLCSTRVPQACTDQQVGLRKFAKTSHSSFPKLLERVTPCAAKTPGPDRRASRDGLVNVDLDNPGEDQAQATLRPALGPKLGLGLRSWLVRLPELRQSREYVGR